MIKKPAYLKRQTFIAWLLIAVISLPSLWQLEHVFDNDHGIIYKKYQTEITSASDTYCNVFHKQLNFNTLLQIFVFNPFRQIFSGEPDTVLWAFYSEQSITSFLLRAPPVLF